MARHGMTNKTSLDTLSPALTWRVCDCLTRNGNPIVALLPPIRIVCLDLDAIVTGSLDPLLVRPEPFVIFGGAVIGPDQPR